MLAKYEYYSYNSPLSNLYLTLNGLQILKLEYEVDDVDSFQTALSDGVLKSWLDAYFSGQPLPQMPSLQIQGTQFQKKVWNVMLTIPYGETLSYGDVSKQLASAPRAVGQACKRNHLPIIIPCHRIVARHSLGGYEGATEGHRLDRKKWLIKHEQSK